MAIGPAIRKMFGPYEGWISDLYRSVFLDLPGFVERIRSWTNAESILELGCGEGAVSEQLVRYFPTAHVTGIDITPRVGRLYRGDPSRVTFSQRAIQDFGPEHVGEFDLLVICDIMHHVPWELHHEILTAARKTLKPRSSAVLKDWERSHTPIHWLCHAADRYITGDRVRYKSADELRQLIEEVFGSGSIKNQARIPPQHNNIAYLILNSPRAR